MSFREGHGVYNPEEQSEQVPEATVAKRRSFTGKLERALRKGVLGMLLIGGVSGSMMAGLELGGRVKYAKELQTLDRLMEKEKKIAELFGGENIPTAATHYSHLLEFRQETKGMAALSGPEELSAHVAWPRGEREKEHEWQTITSDLVGQEGGIQPRVVNRILDETYTKGWVNNEVEIIQQKEQKGGTEALRSRGIEDGSALAECISWEQSKARITFFSPAKKHSLQYLTSNTLAHELAHANSWSADNEMTPEEKADLLLAVAERIFSEDRFKSSYVESISNPDKQQENYLKATEYWAEICGQYFSDPSKLNVKDFSITESFIRKTDQKFDVKKANSERRHLVQQNVQDYHHVIVNYDAKN